MGRSLSCVSSKNRSTNRNKEAGTSKNAIEFVLEKKLKEKTVKKFYGTRLEKFIFWTFVLSFSIGVILGALTYYFKNKTLVIAGILFLIMSMILLLVVQIVNAVWIANKLKNQEKIILSNLLIDFNDDLDIIRELTSLFEIHHLRYAYNHFQCMNRQIRERIALMVGPLAKFGVVPSLLSCYFSLSDLEAKNQITFGKIQWLFVLLILLYLFVVRMMLAVQRVEKIAKIYSESMEIKNHEQASQKMFTAGGKGEMPRKDHVSSTSGSGKEELSPSPDPFEPR